jgi:hypothetical protein
MDSTILGGAKQKSEWRYIKHYKQPDQHRIVLRMDKKQKGFIWFMVFNATFNNNISIIS